MFLQIIQLHRTGVTVQAIVRQVSLSFLLVLLANGTYGKKYKNKAWKLLLTIVFLIFRW